MELPKFVANVLKHLEEAGHEAWCVGGCVRDSLMGREPGDWDVTTSALPEETMAIFKGRAFPTGLRHGTVTVRSGADTSVEVTTYRVDGVYRDHRRPESVSFTRSLEEDLARRDFTVNAMAFNIQGELRDPFGGRQDLMDGVLRSLAFSRGRSADSPGNAFRRRPGAGGGIHDGLRHGPERGAFAGHCAGTDTN